MPSVVALATVQDSSELWPVRMLEGLAVNEVIEGAGARRVAEQLLVAIVEDASAAVTDSIYVPGVTETVWAVDVLPLLHTTDIGKMPPVVVALHMMLEEPGVPAHETLSGDAALATKNEPAKRAMNAAALMRDFFILLYKINIY